MNWKIIVVVLFMALPAIAQVKENVSDPNAIIIKQADELARLEATCINANLFYNPIRKVLDMNQGFLPIHEEGKYKCIFWSAHPVPVIYATVIFNGRGDYSSAKIDTTVRQFNAAEAEAYRLYMAAFVDYGNSAYFNLGPKYAKASIIPIVNDFGRKVYVDYRAIGKDTLLFGNDIEYTFNADDEIISRKKLHISGTCMVKNSLPNGPFGKWFHEHQSDGRDGLSVADLATVFLHKKALKYTSFTFKDKSFLYTFDFETLTLIQRNNDESHAVKPEKTIKVNSATAKIPQKSSRMRVIALIIEAIEFSRLEAACLIGAEILSLEKCPYFPIHEGNAYKLVYFKMDSVPKVVGSVRFDKDFNSDSIVVDSSERDFTDAELLTYKMYQAVVNDVNSREYVDGPKNAVPVPIPMNTVYGLKFYFVWRSIDKRKHLLSCDMAWTFNARYEIIRKVTFHDQGKAYTATSIDDTKPFAGGLFHSHVKDNEPLALISDIGGMMFATNRMRWKNFAIAERKHVYIVDLETHQINQVSHKTYLKAKMKLPEI